jgi:hypothetical protein
MGKLNLTVHEINSENSWKNMAKIPGHCRRDPTGKHIHRGTICEVRICETNKRTLLAIRGSSATDDRISLDSPTRIDLGVDAGKVYEIELRPVGWFGYCRWAWNADDPAYRLPSQISLISLFLGVVGLILGLVSLWPLLKGG